MASPEIVNLNITPREQGSSKWALNFDSVPIDWDNIKDKRIVYLGPGLVGGNHRHPRTEWFIGMGDLVFVWLDEDGVRKETPMFPDGKVKMITVPSFVPHAIINRSDDQFAILLELGSGKLEHVEPMDVLTTGNTS